MARWRDRALALRRPSPRARRAVLFLATAGLGVGLVLAVRDQPDILSDLNGQLVALVALLGVPATTFANAASYLATARMVGGRPLLRSGVEIAILGSAANLLPIPGGAATRAGGLVSGGAPLGDAAWATFLTALVWMAATMLYAGAWMATLAVTPWLWASLLTAAGGTLVLAGYRVTRRSSPMLFVVLLGVQLGLVLTDHVRLYLCLHALGHPASLGQAAALTAGSVAGSVVGLAPAGLGIREGVSAALAPVVGMPAAFGILAAALNRAVALAVLVPVAFWLGARSR